MPMHDPQVRLARAANKGLQYCEVVNNGQRKILVKRLTGIETHYRHNRNGIDNDIRNARHHLYNLHLERRKHEREKLVFDIEYGCHHPDTYRHHIDADIEIEIARRLAEAKARKHEHDYDDDWRRLARNDEVIHKVIHGLQKRHTTLLNRARKQSKESATGKAADSTGSKDSHEGVSQIPHRASVDLVDDLVDQFEMRQSKRILTGDINDMYANVTSDMGHVDADRTRDLKSRQAKKVQILRKATLEMKTLNMWKSGAAVEVPADNSPTEQSQVQRLPTTLGKENRLPPISEKITPEASSPDSLLSSDSSSQKSPTPQSDQSAEGTEAEYFPAFPRKTQLPIASPTMHLFYFKTGLPPPAFMTKPREQDDTMLGVRRRATLPNPSLVPINEKDVTNLIAGMSLPNEGQVMVQVPTNLDLKSLMRRRTLPGTSETQPMELRRRNTVRDDKRANASTPVRRHMTLDTPSKLNPLEPLPPKFIPGKPPFLRRSTVKYGIENIQKMEAAQAAKPNKTPSDKTVIDHGPSGRSGSDETPCQHMPGDIKRKCKKACAPVPQQTDSCTSACSSYILSQDPECIKCVTTAYQGFDSKQDVASASYHSKGHHHSGSHGVTEAAALERIVRNHIAPGEANESNVSQLVGKLETTEATKRKEKNARWGALSLGISNSFNKKIDQLLERQNRVMRGHGNIESKWRQLVTEMQKRQAFLDSCQQLMQMRQQTTEKVAIEPEDLLSTRYLRLTKMNREELVQDCIRKGIKNPDEYIWANIVANQIAWAKHVK